MSASNSIPTSKYESNAENEKVENKPLTINELFVQSRNDERFRVSKLDLTSQEGQNTLIERLRAIEGIFYEAKGRLIELEDAKRTVERLSGKTRWDKERGKENKDNLISPQEYERRKRERESKAMSKVEKLVSNYISLDYEDEDIKAMFPPKKFDTSEVSQAIKKFREKG